MLGAQFRMEEVSVSEIVDPFVETGLDNDVIELLRNSVDRMPWSVATSSSSNRRLTPPTGVYTSTSPIRTGSRARSAYSAMLPTPCACHPAVLSSTWPLTTAHRLPNQSQGAVQALEDAAAIGEIMSPAYGYTNDVEAGLKVYEAVRKPRATRVQCVAPPLHWLVALVLNVCTGGRRSGRPRT
jgi:salicylate hydroxylase